MRFCLDKRNEYYFLVNTQFGTFFTLQWIQFIHCSIRYKMKDHQRLASLFFTINDGGPSTIHTFWLVNYKPSLPRPVIMLDPQDVLLLVMIQAKRLENHWKKTTCKAIADGWQEQSFHSIFINFELKLRCFDSVKFAFPLANTSSKQRCNRQRQHYKLL